MKKKELLINQEEYRIIIKALVEFRNKLIREKRYTDPVDEFLLKITK